MALALQINQSASSQSDNPPRQICGLFLKTVSVIFSLIYPPAAESEKNGLPFPKTLTTHSNNAVAGCHSGVWSTWQPVSSTLVNGNQAILTAAPFRGLPQPEAHYRSGFNGRPYEVRGCVVRFRVVSVLPFIFSR
ncbi:hypothetical protein BHZ80_19480 [Salmonella enterica]|nr:hypothetical protein [Salmonella enterica]EAA9597712.1 hypothetical protein [Salmonella enterica]EAO9640140.1 hypothetical protein [Salmonella enterica]EKI3326445.1 hypothetical protein [Salmonella enterica]